MNKEENKYYVPEIGEFCAGFEFEDRYLDWGDTWSTWSKRTINNLINLGTFDRFIHKEFKSYENIKKYEFRVKYLNSQDIESLGFIKEKKEPTKFDFILGTKFTLDNYNLYLSDDTGRTIITSNDLTRAYEYGIGSKEYTLFNGKIKNKSELKTVLKQIGVL